MIYDHLAIIFTFVIACYSVCVLHQTACKTTTVNFKTFYMDPLEACDIAATISCVIKPHILNIQLGERFREKGFDS